MYAPFSLNPRPLDRFEQARAASAAIEDPELRKRHESMVKVAVANVDMLVAAPDAGPAQLNQRLAGAAATVVADTKKVSSDMRQRQRQGERQHAGEQRSAARDGEWMARHGQHQGQPQGRHVHRASRRHTNAARHIRGERSARRDQFRSGGGSGRGRGSSGRGGGGGWRSGGGGWSGGGGRGGGYGRR
jgi:hypothetical protein